MVNRLLLPAAALAGLDALARGALTLDLGVGRRTRPLGPLRVRIAAPRETVFDVIAAPYLGKTPRAMQSKLQVLERGSDMVLAAHYPQVGGRTTTTVETVRFQHPELVSFRVVRGPVPHVAETYELEPHGDGSELLYTGELGTDLWALGSWWGERVAGPWERTVEASLDDIREEAERKAAR